MDRLFNQIVDTVHATIYGTVVVAGVQGTLGGLMFWWLGLPTPLLWGLVMALLAVVPVLGAFIVWIPASIFLALDGSWEKAIILVLWGGLVVSTIDNLLYPMLVGNRLKLHTVPAFISLVGGLTVFGPAGIVLGPMAVTIDHDASRNLANKDRGAERLTTARSDQRKSTPWHCGTPDEVLKRLGASAIGLTSANARRLLAEHGPNALKEAKPISPWAIFFAQFKSVVIWVLIGAGALSGMLGEAIDAFAIFAIVILNAVVGFYQEFSAEKSISALMRMTAPQAKVRRDGAVTTIAAADRCSGRHP